MNHCTDTIGVDIHGAKLNLRCDHDGLLRYTESLLDRHVVAPWQQPDLEVDATWRVPADDDEARRPHFPVDGLDAFGKRMHLGRDQVVWSDTHRDPNLQLRFRRRGARTAFDVAYLYRPSAKKVAKYGDYERKKFFDLSRYLVWFPIAWHLERTRGWHLIHASAVQDGDKGVLIAGPGGAGKTTTCIALAARAGMTLLTENLALCDGERVYSVCEPIRLTEESLALLGESAGELRHFAAAGGPAKKTMFVPPAGGGAAGVRPALVLLARFSPRAFVQALPPAVAYDLVRATNHLTLELNDYYWYSAALDLLWPGEPRPPVDPLRRLTGRTPCYALGIDRAAGVGPVVEQVLECLRRPASNVLQMEAP